MWRVIFLLKIRKSKHSQALQVSSRHHDAAEVRACLGEAASLSGHGCSLPHCQVWLVTPVPSRCCSTPPACPRNPAPARPLSWALLSWLSASLPYPSPSIMRSPWRSPRQPVARLSPPEHPTRTPARGLRP